MTTQPNAAPHGLVNRRSNARVSARCRHLPVARNLPRLIASLVRSYTTSDSSGHARRRAVAWSAEVSEVWHRCAPHDRGAVVPGARLHLVRHVPVRMDRRAARKWTCEAQSYRESRVRIGRNGAEDRASTCDCPLLVGAWLQSVRAHRRPRNHVPTVPGL
jgi:hypothetical protein